VGLDQVANQELQDFIKLCIGHNSDERPEARQLLKHPFFDSVRAGKAGPDRPPTLLDSGRQSEELAPAEPHSRSPSSSGTDGGGDSPSPKSHATQLIDLREIAQLSAAEAAAEEEAARAAATQAQLSAVAQQLEAAGVQDGGAGGATPPPAAAAAPATGASPPCSGAWVEMPRGRFSLGECECSPEKHQQTPGGGGAPASPAPAGAPGAWAGGAGGSGGPYGGPAGDGGVYPLEEGDDEAARDLSVACQQAEENKLSFQLRFTEPEGARRLGAGLARCWAKQAAATLAPAAGAAPRPRPEPHNSTALPHIAPTHPQATARRWSLRSTWARTPPTASRTR
jgi:WNK lysine deficient protein kinase